ncbi:hypothetical protein CCP2SC5_300015 [Azospirillaceae bacterium]
MNFLRWHDCGSWIFVVKENKKGSYKEKAAKGKGQGSALDPPKAERPLETMTWRL